MNVWLKRGLFGLVTVLIIALVGLAVFLLTFNPNAYKSRLEELVLERYGRTLTIQGDIGLSLFPRIGLSVSGVSLSDRQSRDTFVSVDSARFAVAIWPLLSNHLVVDHVAIAGLKAWVVRDAKGRFNFSDLLNGAPAAASPVGPLAGAVTAPLAGNGHSDFNIDIAGLELKGGQIHYQDLRDGLTTVLTGIEANTGRVTYDQPFDASLKASLKGSDPVQDARLEAQALLRLNPGAAGYAAQKINVQITGRLGNLDKAVAALKGNLAYDGNGRNFSASNLELAVTGDIVGAHPVRGLKTSLAAAQLRLDARNDELKVSRLALRATGEDRGRAVELALDAPALSISPQAAQGDPVTGTLKWSGTDTLAVALRLEGLSGNANELQFRSAGLDGGLTQGTRLLRLTLASPLSWNASLRKGALSAIKGDIGIQDQALPEGRYEVPMIGSVHLDLVRDLLDADLNAVIDGGQSSFKARVTRLADPQLRFSLAAEKLDLNRWLPADRKPAADAAGKPKAAETTAPPASQATAPAPAPEVPVDLGFLKGQDVEGDVKIGDLRIRDVQLTDLGLQLLVRQNALSINKLAARLYEGSLTGQLNAAADQTLALRLNLDKVSVQPFLQALSRKDLLSGQGAAQIDLRAQGATLDALQRSLAGRVAWQVRDGAVQGVDAARSLADVASALGNVIKGRLDPLPSPFEKGRSTPFSTLEGRVDFKGGQGAVSRLSLVSDLIRVNEGKPALIDVPARRLDLLLQVQVAAHPPKALGNTLGDLAGTTVPVLVSGPWDGLDYSVQWSAMRSAAVQDAVKSGLVELLKGKDPIERALMAPETESGTAAPPAGAEGRKDPVGRIGNAIKGLLGQ